MRAESIAPDAYRDAVDLVRTALDRAGRTADDDLVELGALLCVTYPALARSIDATPDHLAAIAGGVRHARDARAYRRLVAAALGAAPDPAAADGERVGRELRRFAAREKLRVAARELLAYPGHDVDVTARELSDLADVCCEVALHEALGWAEARFGPPLTASGERCAFVVVGMGKLGGRELNAGSDIDLMLFYETDDGPAGDRSYNNEYFTRVAQRFVATLDLPTDDGVVWRVDLRLRPEGTRGPLVNALAAAERYYETWGRTWERAALVRARAVAGDLAFGARLLDALSPFVWRRTVDPRVADEMSALLVRARAEAEGGARDDLKIGPGGIREVEFFAQSLQLVWGGREPRVRGANTHDALRRLRACGFVSEREQVELAESYLFLRRLEHRVQFATGLQTHALPRDDELFSRIARSLGYDSDTALRAQIAAVRGRVSARFASLGREKASEDASIERLWAALDALDEAAVTAAAAARFGAAASSDLPRHLLSLAHPADRPLGAPTRDRHPALARRIVDALADAADPEQAARLLASFFGRLTTPGVYLRALAEDPRLVRALCSLLGASAFLGEALVARPDLVDQVAYARGVPTADVARAQVDEEVSALTADEARDVDSFVGALRRAKQRVLFEVGLADLAGELSTREVALVLTALADATLEHACRFAMRERGLEPSRGLALIAMGKLGGREIGYGSDLDLLFVYESPGDDDAERYARTAQRVLRLVGTPHGEGPGYELDTRLRPSGNDGLLVVSLDAFARYQAQQAESWEHQALVKARACAGDMDLGERVIAVACDAAYEHGPPPPERVHHLRMRMQRELAHERPSVRHDLKVGHGGLVDVEFATQWLQMRFGRDRRVRTTDTETALTALEVCGYLGPSDAEALREGWRFLRRLEQRLRIAHGTGVTLIEEGAPGLVKLARSMGFHDVPPARAEQVLVERYVAVTRDVRGAYRRVLGV
ncbi:MAG TPA: bifunctional [glutamate--ammonia ligase]-adenylyl-L-tyrosine phosphorylase/[glutamate--ammonia-ligase] adenylyltransferase [Polyangiaceae bacterium]|nr:bifunctional [glutamate--ammonia ligase]-adenylyl-L-tyrosine phosphorylase/[glutamate--ammonia-ligase] adenylyltransferase [Polyangiaceae bacterium]